MKGRGMIVFLDIDGVIATWDSYNKYPDKLDRKCICVLNRLTKKLNAKIVISSTWRWEHKVIKKLKDAGVEADIIGITPLPEKEGRLFLSKTRGKEIKEWLDKNNYTGEYLVIDDEVEDILKEIHSDNVLWIEKGMQGGLTDTIVNKYLKLF